MFRKVATSASRVVTTSHRFSTTTAVPTLIGQKAPLLDTVFPALLADGSLGNVTIGDSMAANKWAVLFTYPLDFTFVCPSEITSFSDKAAEFAKIDTNVIGASIDSHFCHWGWAQVERKKGGIGKLDIPLIGDFGKQIGAHYGCQLPNGIYTRMTVIIDPKGNVRHISQNDPPAGRNVDEILRLVEAYQFVEKHGEVCPANWNKSTNPDTIKTNLKDMVEYFEKANK